ncbi:MAG: uridine diphosphate-N-acetylglucosamine-binding protein YvcK [Desulfosarcinaceae bacterium]|nr:uridine diphosphate-N-acetylglucosamine-binding protein YvcK [Desulfosarcinaceae bacterium]
MSSESAKRFNIVTIGGGSGQFALLSGLRQVPEFDLTAVVSMVDSGGSTGRLRDEMGILPPGDILKCILALSPHQEVVRQLLLKRFKVDRRLKGHNAGNMLLTMLSRYTGSFSSGVSALAEILDVHGKILPVTMDRATLVAELTDGTRVFGESAIDMPRGTQREKIRDVYLVPHHSDAISIFPPVMEAINKADFIILGPGDLFTSIIPNLVVPRMPEALRNTRASLLYVLNIMTKYGETHNFKARDFVAALEENMKRPIDGILFNDRPPSPEQMALYRAQKAEWVIIEERDFFWRGRRRFGADLIETDGTVVRHDSTKLATQVRRIVMEGLLQ